MTPRQRKQKRRLFLRRLHTPTLRFASIDTRTAFHQQMTVGERRQRGMYRNKRLKLQRELGRAVAAIHAAVRAAYHANPVVFP